MGWGKERKKNGGPATANQGDRWGERAETEAFANRECYKKQLITQPLQRTHLFRKYVQYTHLIPILISWMKASVDVSRFPISAFCSLIYSTAL
jgi:hypothetical protein